MAETIDRIVEKPETSGDSSRAEQLSQQVNSLSKDAPAGSGTVTAMSPSDFLNSAPASATDQGNGARGSENNQSGDRGAPAGASSDRNLPTVSSESPAPLEAVAPQTLDDTSRAVTQPQNFGNVRRKR